MANIEYTRKFDGMGNGKEIIQFSEEAIQNPAKSEAAGRPIYDSVEMVEISFPGNNLTVVSRKVTDEDRERYKPQYDAFKRHGGTIIDGTPLEAWTALSKAQVREFQAMKVFTIEQLANMDDLGVQRIGMGGQMWRERAKLFIDSSEDNAAVDRVASENFRLKERVETQAEQIAQLGAMCSALQHQMQNLQNGRPDMGLPVQALPSFAVAPPPMSPELAAGALGQPADGYIPPRRRGPGRPSKSEVAA